MMQKKTNQFCPECKAPWEDGKTCQEAFHQMLFWEYENPAFDVHHLMVLCYYLQHPSLYSPEGLETAKHLLADFVERGFSPDEVRKQNRDRVDSSQRTWKIKGTTASHGAYKHPNRWGMTAKDVIAGGASHYCDNVRKWARLVLEALQTSDNY